jgi:hypothetical protein
MDTVDADTFASAIISPLTGRALLEALLRATPIAAYGLNWQRILITTGATSSLLLFREWQEIADSVEDHLCNPELATKWEKILEHGLFRSSTPRY